MSAGVNSAEWWDEKALKYIRKSDSRDRPSESQEAAARVTGSVLEMGCAFGHFSKYLPAEIAYLGIDVSEVLLEEARKNYPARVFIKADVAKFALHQWEKAFDHVCSFQVLEHFTHTELHSLLLLFSGMSRKSLIFSVPRGRPSQKEAQNEGHLIGWRDEGELAAEIGRHGNLAFWAGAENHICGELTWRS